MRQSIISFYDETVAYVGRAKSLSKALSISVLNQIISSLTNFTFGLYLVRVLTIAEYGLYGIGFAISIFFAGIGNALFLVQMVVHTPDKAPEDRLPYAARMFTAVAIFCLIASLLAVVVFLVGGRFWEPLAKYTHFGLVVTAASIAYLLKEFFIRHAYNVRKEIWALAVNLILFASMAILLAGQYFSHITLTVEAALWIYTLAHIIAAVFGCFKSRLPFKKIHSRGLGEDWRESWRDGLWASITNLVSFLRGQAHTIVAVALMGPIGVGKINAARLFVTPAVMLTPALAQIAIPRLSTLRTQGMQKMLSASRLVTAALFAVAMLYSIVLLMTYYFISPLIMGFKYENLFTLTMAWCVYACIFSMRSGAEMNMQALMEFKFITSANIYSAFMALGFSFILALIWSLPGIVIGLAIGEMVLFIFYQRRQLIAGIYSKINSAIL